MNHCALGLTFCSLLVSVRGVISPFSPGITLSPEPIWAQGRYELITELDEDISTTTLEPLPYFEEEEANMTAQLGSDIFLHCKVERLGEKTISWLRRRGPELHLLSVGKSTYAADNRYSLAIEWPRDWRLKIQYLSQRDEGWYECQLSTHPPIFRRTYLHVIVPEVSIVDERGDKIREKLYKEGSIISLRCLAKKAENPARRLAWRHGGRLLNYDTRRGGVSVKIEPLDDGALSRLYIANANRKDSGNYTCSLGETASAYVTVHVLKGENPQAMQRGTASCQTYHLTVTMSIIS